jgi:hypothetical protein
MSFDRWYSTTARLASVMAFILLLGVSAQADDTWHNVYHSLRRFFTGKPNPTPVVHHHVRRSEDREKNNHLAEPTPPPAEGTPSPESSTTPRVVILPATTPTTSNAEATPATENSTHAPEAAVKPTPSPELGPVLRSLSGPNPANSPAVPSSSTPGSAPN